MSDIQFLPALLQKYDVGDLLGRSASATVFRAIDKETKVQYAVKVIKKSMVTKPDRLVTEVRALQRAKHKYITYLKEVLEDEHMLYLVVELAAGGELFDRLIEKNGPYPESSARILIKNLIEAVAYLHSIDIVHRDLKPENILLSSKDNDTDIKLTDFGVVKLFEEAKPTRQAVTFTYIGTSCYMAPEVLLGIGYDHSVDMWSVGVILYIVVSGAHPFDQDKADSVEDVIKGKYDFPDNRFSRISPQCKNLIRQLLTVDPLKRPSAREALRHPWLLMM